MIDKNIKRIMVMAIFAIVSSGCDCDEHLYLILEIVPEVSTYKVLDGGPNKYKQPYVVSLTEKPPLFLAGVSDIASYPDTQSVVTYKEIYENGKRIGIRVIGVGYVEIRLSGPYIESYSKHGRVNDPHEILATVESWNTNAGNITVNVNNSTSTSNCCGGSATLCTIEKNGVKWPSCSTTNKIAAIKRSSCQ